MNEVTKYFYAFNSEDQQAQILQSANKIDSLGRVLDPTCDETLFDLDADDIQILRTAVIKEESVYSRFSHLLGKFSLIEVAKVTNQAAQSLYLPKPQYIVRGSVLRHLLKNRHIKIYETWSGLSITPLYKANLAIKINDRDWVILMQQIKRLHAIRLLIDIGLSTRMEANLKEEKINPAFIALNLAQAHFQAESSPPGSYPRLTAANQSKQISTTDTDLYKNYIELCGFRRAQDKMDVVKQQAYSERVLGGNGESTPNDYYFTNTAPTTATPINSIYLNITPLLDDVSSPRFLISSVLGPSNRVQAVCDQVLGNLTYVPHQGANYTDFAASLSHFTLGGRSYETGGIDKNFQALKEEADKRKMFWFELLGSQLISRVKYHHQDQAAVLIALAFNASAILIWKYPQMFGEIQQLWKIILGHSDKLEKRESFHHVSSNKLLNHIHMNVSDPNSSFFDLYAQLQVTTAIEQNRLKTHPAAYKTFSTQTDGHVFNQIVVPVDLGAEAPARLYLFFPYDLLRSLKQLAVVYSNNMLHHLHELMVPTKEVFFQIEGSPLAGYFMDPRRHSELCFEESRKLMKIADERAWKMGFLAACSLLSQKNSEHFIKKITIDLMRMLLLRWPSAPFKKEMAAILHQTFIKSGIFFVENFFDKLMQSPKEGTISLEQILHVASACLKTDLRPFIEIASEFIHVTKKEDTETFHLELYKKLCENCLSKAYAPEAIAENALSFLVDSLNNLAQISHINKIDVLCELFQNNKVQNATALAKKIVEAVLSNLSALIEWPSKDEKLEESLLDVFQKMAYPVIALDYFREMARLKLIAKPDMAQKLWEALMQLVPAKDEQAVYNYLSGCLAAAKERRLWPWLTESQQESFSNKYTACSQKIYMQTGQADLIVKMHIMDDEEVHHSIHRGYIKSVQDQLKAMTADKLGRFIEELKWLHCTCQETSLVTDVITACCHVPLQDDEERQIYAFLDNFQRAHGVYQPNQMAAFWFEQLSMLEKKEETPSRTALSRIVLQLMLVLVSKLENATQFPEDFYRRLINLVISENAKEAIISISKPVLQELNRRHMVSEILALAVVGSIPYSDGNCKILSDVFSEMLSQGTIDILESQLLQLPNWILEDDQILGQVVIMYDILAKRACEVKDFVKGWQWLNQILINNIQLDQPAFQLAIQIFKGLIAGRKLPEACGLALALPESEGQARTWLEVCKTLLQAQEVSACLQFIRQHPSLNMAIKSPVYTDQIRELFDVVKDNIQRLSNFQNKSNLLQLQKLCNLMGYLIRSLQPNDPQVWIDYFHLISKNGSISEVEGLFWHLVDDGKASMLFPDAKQRMKSCWMPIFERFNGEVSPALTTLIMLAKRVADSEVTDFKIPILTEYLTQNEYNKMPDPSLADFYSHILGGIVKALSKETNRSDQKKCVEIFFRSIDMEVLTRMPVIFNAHQAMLDIAEIAFLGNTAYSLMPACSSAYQICISMKNHPIAEEAAVRIVNQVVKRAMNFKEKDLYIYVMSLIGIVQKSAYCDDGDHWIFLEYLHKFEDKAKIKNMIKAVSKTGKAQISIAGLHFEEKMASVIKVLENPYSKRKYTPNNKQLVNETFKQLQYVYAYFGEELQTCLESTNLTSLAIPETIKIIRDSIGSYQQMTSPDKYLAKLYRSCITSKLAFEREKIHKKHNMLIHRFMPLETKAMKEVRNFSNALAKAAIVSLCAMAFFFYLWQNHSE